VVAAGTMTAVTGIAMTVVTATEIVTVVTAKAA
jgi:hypothetical protein